MKNFKKIKKNRGMTYVELIVVLSIFATLSSIAIFNYNGFQANVDIKNLASDIALQIVQAQKASLSGLLPSLTQQTLIPPSPFSWKPSYGVYFSIGSSKGADSKDFIYFVDLNNNYVFDGLPCTGMGECLNKVTITKNNSIKQLGVFYLDGSSTLNLSDLTVTFQRPNSGTTIKSSTTLNANISYAQITITSQNGGVTSTIKVYASGRIQIN